MTWASTCGPVRVLLDTREKHWTQNPYIWQLAQVGGRELDFVGFGWRRALFGRFDILHVHWPEFLVRSPGRPARALLMKALFLALLARLLVTRVPVVKTCHNVSPHESLGRLDSTLLALLDRRVGLRVLLIPGGCHQSQPAVVIPHPDYSYWLNRAGAPVADAHRRADRRISIVGLVRRYKRIEDAIRSFRGLPDEDLQLVIRGASPDQAYSEELRLASVSDSRVDVAFGRVSDAEMVSLIQSSDLVLIPYPEPGNSGVALLALSLGTPVAMRPSPALLDLRADYGPEWVRSLDEGLSTESLGQVVSQHPPRRAATPDRRGWPSFAHDHMMAYRSLSQSGRRHASKSRKQVKAL